MICCLILHGVAWFCLIVLGMYPPNPRSFFHSLSGCRTCEVILAKQLRGLALGGGIFLGSAEQALRSAEQAL